MLGSVNGQAFANPMKMASCRLASEARRYRIRLPSEGSLESCLASSDVTEVTTGDNMNGSTLYIPPSKGRLALPSTSPRQRAAWLYPLHLPVKGPPGFTLYIPPSRVRLALPSTSPPVKGPPVFTAQHSASTFNRI